jgi:hypothetical protein
MREAVEAEYLADEQMLKLERPLDGVSDHQRVRVVIEQAPGPERDAWPTVSDDAGRELAQAVRDAFGRDGIAV